MNIITNQPINSIYKANNISNNNSRPSFTAKPKAPTGAQVKKGLNVAQKLYGMIFTPMGEKLKMIKDGHAFTEMKLNNPNIIFGKKYKLYSREPEMIVRNDMKSKIQTRLTPKGETNDVLIRDFHAPEHEVSVGYKNVNKKFDIYTNDRAVFWSGGDYKGDVAIKYGDKQINISNEERERILGELSESTSKKYNQSIKELTGLGYEKFQEYITKYYQDPEIIGQSILSSPASLENQVTKIPSSMPYGIEEIMKHMK